MTLRDLQSLLESPFRNYANFSGPTGPAEFWLFILTFMILTNLASIIGYGGMKLAGYQSHHHEYETLNHIHSPEDDTETKRRATCAAKITPYAWRAFKGVRSCAPPFEILERHADPGNDRRGTIPATFVAMAITAPARLSLELPAGFPAKAVPSCCHDGLL